MKSEKRKYWCSQCNLEHNYPPLIEWRKSEYEYYMFCSRNCANEYKKRLRSMPF